MAEPIRSGPYTVGSPEDESPTVPFGPTNGMISKMMSSSTILNQLTNGGTSRPHSPANSTVSDAGGRHYSNTKSSHRRHHTPGQLNAFKNNNSLF